VTPTFPQHATTPQRKGAASRAARGLAGACTLLLALSAWPAPAQAEEASGARTVSEEPVIIEDIAYAEAEPEDSTGHLLDLYLPQTPGDSAAPLLIVTGGSGWMAENGKDYGAALAPHFNAEGFAVAGVSIRASTNEPFPAQVHDIKAAVRWLRANAGDHGIDPERIAVLGNSSGGWAATMAGVTGNVPELEGDRGVTGVSSEVQAVVNLYGPTDFLQMDEHMIDCDWFNQAFNLQDCHNDPTSPEGLLIGGLPIQEHPEAVQEANPITYVDAQTPPLYIVHGQEDMLVPHHQSELLFDAAHEAGAYAVFHSVPGAGHDAGVYSPEAEPSIARQTRNGKISEVHGPRGERPTLDVIAHFLHVELSKAR
jgi:acetyl esterase/lipase